MHKLIIDLSPILYSNLISVTSEMVRNGAQEVNGKIPYDYANLVIFRIIEEITEFAQQFRPDEIILATDNSKGGYWRKDYWAGYKFKRAGDRQKTNVDWDSAFETFNIIKTKLRESSSYKVIDIPRVEGDDVMFVLCEEFSNHGDHTTIVSLDHDMIYNLKHPNVSYYRTRKSQKKASSFVDITPGEILELEIDHLIGGDPGDYIKNVKAYSQFSPEFKAMYPDKKEIDVWEKRHELDVLFTQKTGKSAYKHPRYGYKMFMNSKKTVQGLLLENEIYQKNYEINKKVAMPDGIPQEIRTSIIDQYNTTPNKKNSKELQKFFIDYNLFELNSVLSLL